MGPLNRISAKLPDLGNPRTFAAATVAIDRAHTQLWEAVASRGTLQDLANAARARNVLYHGDALGLMLQSLASGAAPTDAAAANHVLSLLDTLCKPLGQEVEATMQRALGRERLVSVDPSQLNVLRAKPAFVAFALDCFVSAPDDSTHRSTVNAYILGLVQMEGTDDDTAAALGRLLQDERSRRAMWRALSTVREVNKLVMVLQLLKRCCGGDAGMQRGFSSWDVKVEPPHTLQELLDAGGGAPLAAACKQVAALCRTLPRADVALGSCRMTLLDCFDLLLAGSDGFAWPEALLQAHVELVVESLKLAPLYIYLHHMRPYSSCAAAARAVEALGPDAMGAITAVLATSSPSDTLMLNKLVDSYGIIQGLISNSPRLAKTALDKGASKLMFLALQHWAGRLPGLGPAPQNFGHMPPGMAASLARVAEQEGEARVQVSRAALQLLKALLRTPGAVQLATQLEGQGVDAWTTLLGRLGDNAALKNAAWECLTGVRDAGSAGDTGAASGAAQRGATSSADTAAASSAKQRGTGNESGTSSSAAAVTPEQQGLAAAGGRSTEPGASAPRSSSSPGQGGTAAGTGSTEGGGSTGLAGLPTKCQRVCASCGGAGVGLKRCARCRDVWYCNAGCQRSHWGAHKASCIQAS